MVLVSIGTTLYPDHLQSSSLTNFVLSVAAELGDYDPRRHSPGYVSEFRFVANQTAELETKISEHHKELQWVTTCYHLQYRQEFANKSPLLPLVISHVSYSPLSLQRVDL